MDVGVNARLANGVFRAGRHEHGPHVHRQLRHPARAAGDQSSGVPVLSPGHELADPVQGSRRRTRFRASTSRSRRPTSTCRAPRSMRNWVDPVGRDRSLAWPSAVGWSSDQTVNLVDAGHDVQRRVESARSALRQDPPDRHDAHDDQLRPLQRHELEHDPDAEQRVTSPRRRRRRGRYRPRSCSRASGRSARSSISDIGSPGGDASGADDPPKARPPTWTGFCH